ncbi:MAG: triose-phosphate isomerase [Deltaproteobacteria bacterium]|nr:triose-phosphate isomerase [Deltaproteobacteria bacterium]
MGRKWVGTGWKMNKLLAEAEAYARSLREFVDGHAPEIEVFIVPPFTVLRRTCEILKGSPVKVGAQNMHWEERGAFTGEISPLMVKDCGADLVELGHSERRAQFGETDYTVNRKVLAALGHGLRPLVCVGETGPEKAFGVARECVARQVKIALKDVPESRIGEVILAYEPVWAIGESGTPAEPDYANSVHGVIRDAVSGLYGSRAAGEVPVLYGGSVDAENGPLFVREKEVDGLFVGRAAWDVRGLIRIIEAVQGESRGRPRGHEEPAP